MGATTGTLRERKPMSPSAKEFEEFARDCVRLAERADTPELREKLLNLAREWMQAVMDDEDADIAKHNRRPIPHPGLPGQKADKDEASFL
jgi:hypothetical protein